MRKVSSTGVQGFFIALVIHSAGLAGLFVLSPTQKSKATVRPAVKVRMASRPQSAELQESPPEQKQPIVVDPKKPLGKKVANQKKAPQLAPPAQKPSQELELDKKVPRKFTVAMEATVSSGGVAVPTSSDEGWAFGAPDGDPEAEKALADSAPAAIEEKGPEVRQVSGVTRLPRLIYQPSELDKRSIYPEAARREGLEANVYLKILVDSSGKVVRVKLVQGAGKGFDQASIRLVKKFRFGPAEIDGQPVSVWIPWTYKFRLQL